MTNCQYCAQPLSTGGCTYIKCPGRPEISYSLHGWLCPACKRGNSPFTKQCSCLDEEKSAIYPCNKCGKLRTKAEGGTTFTVCDSCWGSK